MSVPSRRKQARRSAALPPSLVPRLIARKRDGGALASDEIEVLIDGYATGLIPDYQMSAFAMATLLRGMETKETTALTFAMRDSGAVVDLSKIPGPKVDKHSTGGVGDKISICLAPLVAACGVRVPMMSGRGLGHTGGTLDKLEAIPGFCVDQSITQLRALVRKHGFALIGQTANIAPADRKFYALRDVTGTVESIPLITASILSKKLAEGIDSLVLDCKVGGGAFMKTEEDARQLAKTLTQVGKKAGLRVRSVLTDMNQPLGLTIGNAIETAEAIEILHNAGPDDVRQLTLTLARHMLELAGVAKGAKATKLLEGCLRDGTAAKRLHALVVAQGGDGRVVEEPDRLPLGRHRLEVQANRTGYVSTIDAYALGIASMDLGAGRSTAEASIDHAAGIKLHAKVGEYVKRNRPLATLYTSQRKALSEVAPRVRNAFAVSAARVSAPPLVLDVLR